MTMYVFRCAGCGPFEASFPIGTAPEQLSCPECSRAGVKLITAPRIGHGANGYSRALDRAAASADRPQVINGPLPGQARRPTPVTRNPLHSKLPRP